MKVLLHRKNTFVEDLKVKNIQVIHYLKGKFFNIKYQSYLISAENLH